LRRKNEMLVLISTCCWY